jgi:adenylate cyclase
VRPHGIQRRLAALFSADVKGYSRLMGEDEVATVRTLIAYREVMTARILEHGGRVVDCPGDNLLAEFASVVDAVQCAVDIQQELTTRNAALPLHRRMEFRIGNPSCYLLEIHELLRSNEGEISITLGEEEAHGRQNYRDVLSV